MDLLHKKYVIKHSWKLVKLVSRKHSLLVGKYFVINYLSAAECGSKGVDSAADKLKKNQLANYNPPKGHKTNHSRSLKFAKFMRFSIINRQTAHPSLYRDGQTPGY